MKKIRSKPNLANRSLPALLAVGGSMAAMPAVALELGDLTVQSNLGQPLRASIAYALAPTEQLSAPCISLRTGATASGLPNIGRATISVADGIIRLTGATAIREPMVSAHVSVNCPYTANISREYMLFIDPATVANDQPSFAAQITTQEFVSTAAPAAHGQFTDTRPKTWHRIRDRTLRRRSGALPNSRYLKARLHKN